MSYLKLEMMEGGPFLSKNSIRLKVFIDGDLL